MTMLRHRHGEWSRRTQRSCHASREVALGMRSRIQTTTSIVARGRRSKNIAFEPEDGDIFDEWLNGGDDGCQEAAWEAAIAIWDREFSIGRARQRDRMFCVTEYMLRMPHGSTSSTDAAWLVILGDAAFWGVREASWLKRIIARRISAASRRRWKPPSLPSSVEKVKRQRRDDDRDPSSGSGGSGAASGACAAPIGSA